MISHLYPGINPLTVMDLTYRWWIIYVAHAKHYLEENKQAEREQRRQL